MIHGPFYVNRKGGQINRSNRLVFKRNDSGISILIRKIDENTWK